MRKVAVLRAPALLVSLGCVVALTLAASALAGPEGSDNGTACVYNTQLRPENELPTPADSEAKGHAQIKVRNDGTIEYRFFILNKEGEQFFVGHIHRKVPGTEIGPPIAGGTLFATAPANNTTDRHIRGDGELTGTTFASDICENPTNYYVNFHTRQIPAGAIRGDLG